MSLKKLSKEMMDMEFLSDSDFIEREIIATGTASVIFRAKHWPTGRVMSIKNIGTRFLDEINKRDIIFELDVLNRLNFPHLLRYYGAFPSLCGISICGEYMNGGSLDRIMNKTGPIPEYVLRVVALAVLQVLEYLHGKHVLFNQCIKPSNILVSSSGQIKICDFAIPARLRRAMQLDVLNNANNEYRSYLAPEHIQGAPYSVKAEIWSLGLSLMELATGVYPYPRPNARALDAFFMPRGCNGSHPRSLAPPPTLVTSPVRVHAPANYPQQGTASDEYVMTLADMFAREEEARALPAASASSVPGTLCMSANVCSITQADEPAENGASDRPSTSSSNPVAWDPQRLTLFAVIDAIVNGQPPELPHSSRHLFSDDFRDFVELCLLKSPYERPGLTLLMNHPWIRQALRENVSISDWVIETMQF